MNLGEENLSRREKIFAPPAGHNRSSRTPAEINLQDHLHRADMEADRIAEILREEFPTAEIVVEREMNLVRILVVSGRFAGMGAVERQRLVYAPLTEFILGNHIHALSIETLTPEEHG